MARKRRRGKRFRLLIYERMWKRWAWPCILILPAAVVLWWVAPSLSITHPLYRALALVPAFVSLALLAFTFLARRRAWVECRRNHVRIQTPLYPLVFSYARIKATRPQSFAQVFPPSQEKAARRSWLGPYWGKTVLLVEISQYPVSKTWLRLWLSPYLLSPASPGFVFLVDDWMGLSRQLDDFRNAWSMRRAARRERRLSHQK
ncbi:MAG: hypothetical protein DRI48_01980 [Chloroflexi bacterium]|nr:MAG: hypothetical protein DRI48_01980 [Chloroflexota bacterium]